MSANDNQKCIWLKTSRNTDLLYYEEYFYLKNYLRNDIQYWRCQIRKCGGKLRILPNNDIITNGIHNHIVSEVEKNLKFFNNKVKSLSENTSYPTNQVYNILTNTANLSDLPLIPKGYVYRNILNNRKRNNIDTKPVNDSYETLKTLRNESFCLHDSGPLGKNRLIMFATKENLLHLKHSDFWIADGTFKVAPPTFCQLYVIHGVVFHKVVPLVYVLMPNKTQSSYELMIKIIQEKGNIELPRYIIVDFEIAAYNAFKKASKYPVYFCLFHFGQCVYRQIQSLCFSNDYKNNEKFRLFIKSFTSLAFVPIPFVKQEFEKLKVESQQLNFNIDRFIQYFYSNFIDNPKYPLEAWNAYNRLFDDVKLTSNSAEIFNRHFFARFSQSHSGILTFIKGLKEHQSSVEQDISYQLCNPTSEPYGKKTTEKYTQMKNICENFHGYSELFYLHAVTRTYNWKFE